LQSFFSCFRYIPRSGAGYFSHCRKVTKRQFGTKVPKPPYLLGNNWVPGLLMPPSVSLGGVPCSSKLQRFGRRAVLSNRFAAQKALPAKNSILLLLSLKRGARGGCESHYKVASAGNRITSTSKTHPQSSGSGAAALKLRHCAEADRRNPSRLLLTFGRCQK